MVTRISLALLALASFNAAAQSQPPVLTSPNFEHPFACAYKFTGITSRDAKPNLAIEFERSSAVTDPVLVSAPGIVRTVRDLGYGSLGRYIVVDHGGGWSTTYSNLARVDVRANQVVVGGQRLGVIGRLGDVETTYLHYMQSRNGFPEIIRFNGQWATYYGASQYTSTTNCGTEGPVQGVVELGTQVGFVWVRNDPYLRALPFGELFQGSRVTVECQVTGGNYLALPNDAPSPYGSELWYRVNFAGRSGYVPAPQVKLSYGSKAALCR